MKTTVDNKGIALFTIEVESYDQLQDIIRTIKKGEKCAGGGTASGRLKGSLNGFFNKAGFDAVGACLDFDVLTVPDTFDSLKIGVPAFLGFIVGVADVVTGERSLATDIAYF